MSKRKIKQYGKSGDTYISYRAVRDIHAFIYFSILIIYISSVLFRFPINIDRPFPTEIVLIAGIFGIWFLSLMLHIWFVNRIHHLQAHIQILENEKQSQKQHQNYPHLMNSDDNRFTDEDLYFQEETLQDPEDTLPPNTSQGRNN
jgi:hypothetical protein